MAEYPRALLRSEQALACIGVKTTHPAEPILVRLDIRQRRDIRGQSRVDTPAEPNAVTHHHARQASKRSRRLTRIPQVRPPGASTKGTASFPQASAATACTTFSKARIDKDVRLQLYAAVG
jgi:hypothetical protein